MNGIRSTARLFYTFVEPKGIERAAAWLLNVSRNYYDGGLNGIST